MNEYPMIIDTRAIPPHPAPFSPELLPIFADAIRWWADTTPYLHAGLVRVLDPFAGIGRVHQLVAAPLLDGLEVFTYGVELMPAWAAAHSGTIQGDATDLPPPFDAGEGSASVEVVVTSPCYGNRFADHHDAADTCKRCGGRGTEHHAVAGPCSHLCTLCRGSGLSPRRSYRHYYERDGADFFADAPLSTNAGAMAWGEEYRDLHARAWAEVHRVLVPGGLFVLNIKDHVRGGQRQRVSAWHHRTIRALGFTREWHYTIGLGGFRHGENHAARVDDEYVYAYTKGVTR